MGDPDSPTEPMVPEEQARRILALAAEFDSRDGVTVPLSQLREIAQEAGISSAALERAIESITHPSPRGLLRRFWNRITSWLNVSPLGPLSALTINVLAFAGAFTLVSFSTRLASLLGGHWVVTYGLIIIATLAGLGMAVRTRARLTAALLAIVAAAQLAVYPIRLLYGFSNTVPEVALLLAAGFGLLLSRVLARPVEQPHALPPNHPAQSRESDTSPPETPVKDRAALSLRPAVL